MTHAGFWKTLRTGRVEINDRAVLLWIRWLFFLVLSFLVLYTYSDHATLSELWLKVGLLAFYAISNTLLMWATCTNLKLERWSHVDFSLTGHCSRLDLLVFFRRRRHGTLSAVLPHYLFIDSWDDASGTRFR